MSEPYWKSHDATLALYHGDCLEVMADMDEASVDAPLLPQGFGER